MEWYYEQMENASPITQQDLDARQIKHFTSGKPIEVGDIVFYGFLQTVNEATEEVTMEFITFQKNEIGTKYKNLNKNESYGINSPFPILQIIPDFTP